MAFGLKPVPRHQSAAQTAYSRSPVPARHHCWLGCASHQAVSLFGCITFKVILIHTTWPLILSLFCIPLLPLLSRFMIATPVSSSNQPALQACNSINRIQFLALHLSQLISNFAPIALYCTVPLSLSAFAVSSDVCCQANCLTCALQYEGQALHP